MVNNCQVNLGRKTLRIKNNEVSLFNQEEEVEVATTRIVVRKTVVIPAMSEAIVLGRIEMSSKGNGWALVKPLDDVKCKVLDYL